MVKNFPKLQGPMIHSIILGLKYSLNFLKDSFIPCRKFSGGVGFLCGGHFSGGIFPSVINFKGAFSSRVSCN